VLASEGRRREWWNHTCAVLAQMAEIHRDPKKRSRPFDAAEMHPMRTPIKPKEVDAADLIAMGAI